VYRDLSARRTYEDSRYIFEPTFNGDSTARDSRHDTDNYYTRQGQKGTHAIHIKRRWEKKRKKILIRQAASTVIDSPLRGRNKISDNYNTTVTPSRSIKHQVLNEKQRASRKTRSLIKSASIPLVVLNEKSSSDTSWDDERINWEPVALVNGTLYKTNDTHIDSTNNSDFSSRLLELELNADNSTFYNHTHNSLYLNASSLETNGNHSSDLGLVARFKKNDDMEWVEIELKNSSLGDLMEPPPTKATFGVHKPRSTFQSPYDPAIISLSPEVPHLVKDFISNSHVDLMKHETLVVKYQSGGEPHITGIYTTSPTVDGTLFGVVNSNIRPQINNRPPVYNNRPFNHNNGPPSYNNFPPLNHNNRPQPLQPPMPPAPNPTIYSNFLPPSGPAIYNNIGQYLPSLPTIYEGIPPHQQEPPQDSNFEQTLHNKPNFGVITQVNNPNTPFRPSFASGVISSTVIGIAENPIYQNNRPPFMHGGNYQHQNPDPVTIVDDTLVETVSEESSYDTPNEPEVIEEVVDEVIEELAEAVDEETTQPAAPPNYLWSSTTSNPFTAESEIPHPDFTTSKPPTVIYGGVQFPIKPSLSHDPNCPNLTIIVSPTITNNNIQNIVTAPPSTDIYRPPNYPPPNYGGHYGFKPPAPFPAKPPNLYPNKPTAPFPSRPPLLAQQQIPPSDDTPVEEVEEVDDELSNQEATVPPVTEAPPAGSSEAPPVVTDAPPAGATTTMRPSVLNDFTNVFFNTSSPFFWLVLVSPVVLMLAMLVGMTQYVVPSWRSSDHHHHDPNKEIAHNIVITKHKYKTTTKKPPKKKKRPPRGEPAGVPGVLWGRRLDMSDVRGRRRRRFLEFGIT